MLLKDKQHGVIISIGGANFAATRSSRSSTFSNMSSQAENLFPTIPRNIKVAMDGDRVLWKAIFRVIRFWQNCRIFVGMIIRSTSRIEPGEESTGTEGKYPKIKARGESILPSFLLLLNLLALLIDSPPLMITLLRANRRRNPNFWNASTWLTLKWASIHTSYELEHAFAKEPLLTLDGETLGISDWMRSTTARTWKVGLFSQQGQWINMKTNLARRMVKAHSERGTDTTTQLADATIQLTPFSRAIDAEITYELDKKLTTQRREIYTDIHPLTGNRIQPGEGYYVRLDDLRYVEDPEEGTYIKIYQNVGDRPTTAVDAAFRLRVQPRQFFARRAQKSTQFHQNRFHGAR